MERSRAAISLFRKCLLVSFSLHFLFRVCTAMVGLQVNVSTPEAPLKNVLHIATPGNGSMVLVSGRSRLYELSADTLSLEASLPTGSINDSQVCPPHALPCDYEGTTTDNDNHILLPLHSDAFVMACGKTTQGMCSVHQVSQGLNFTKSTDGTFSDNYLTSRPLTVAFFGSGRNRNVLFVASTYDGHPSDYRPHALSAWVLTTSDSFSLRSSTPATVSSLSVADYFKNSYRVRYLYGFSYNGFAYFVTVQNRGYSPGTVETKLARVCESDVSFQTYSELPIRCPRKIGAVNSQERIAVSAAFEHSLIANNSHSKVLAVAFGTPFDGLWNSSDPSQGSELCFFDMDSVETAFRETIKSCNKGSKTAALIQYFGRNQLDSSCAPTNKSDDNIDVCKPGANTHIEGLVPLIGRATLDFQEGLVTSITLMQQNGVIVAWVGDNSGYLHKVKLDGESSKLLFWTDLAYGENISIGKSTAIDKEGAYGYFLLRDKVVKFPVGSCSIYRTCSKCLRGHDDPLQCGWCGGRCAHAAECRNGTDLVFDRCPVEVHMVYPRSGPITGGTMLTFLGDNFGYWWREASNSIKITVSGQPCRIINWVSTLVKCQTPAFENATKVDIAISVNDTNRDTKKTYDVIDTLRIPSCFEYKVAKVSEVLPEFGPIAGGTNITLRGVNLDIGSHRTVTVGGYPCSIHKINDTELECTTAAARTDRLHHEMQVTLSIDGVAVPYASLEGLRTKFTYMPDPVIDGITPVMANFSETPTFEVKGVHLDSVYNPRMMVQLHSLNKQQKSITKACHVLDNGQKMVCTGPSLTEIFANSSTELHAHRHKIPAHISFKMDGLHLPLRSVGSKGYFTFIYCPALLTGGCDEETQESKVSRLTAVLPRYGPVAGGTNLTLFGNNLDAGSVRVVRIGGSQCKINSVSSAFLGCTTSAVASGESGRDKRVTFTIDSTEVPFFMADHFTSIFTYKPDPVIYEILPPRHIFSGLSDIDVRGKHLDSAAAPFMLTHVLSSNHQESHTGGVCRVVWGGRRMLCPIASVVGSCVTGRSKREAHAFRVLVRISFQMDGLRLLANGTTEEHHFYCTFQRETNFTTLPHQKPDIKKTAIVTIAPFCIAIAFATAVVLGMAILLGKCGLYRRLWTIRTKANCDDICHVFAGSMKGGCGEQENGNAQGARAEERQVLIDSSFLTDKKVLHMLQHEQLSKHVWPGMVGRTMQESSAPDAIGQQSSGNRRVNVDYQLISHGTHKECRGDNDGQLSNWCVGHSWPQHNQKNFTEISVGEEKVYLERGVLY